MEKTEREATLFCSVTNLAEGGKNNVAPAAAKKVISNGSAMKTILLNVSKYFADLISLSIGKLDKLSKIREIFRHIE